jgi:NTP pyrophosphatase (non-canonical NTP hydrolase)
MTFNEMQQGVMDVAEQYSAKYGITIDQDFALLKLYEEMGEFAQSVLIHRKKSRPEKHATEQETKEMVAHELADIVGLAIINANLFGIDLQQALEDKWFSKIQ